MKLQKILEEIENLEKSREDYLFLLKKQTTQCLNELLYPTEEIVNDMVIDLSSITRNIYSIQSKLNILKHLTLETR